MRRLWAIEGTARRTISASWPGRLNRMVVPLFDNGSGDASAETFFSVVKNQIGQMFRTQSVHQPRGRFARQWVESQIQRSIGVETKTPRGVGQLIARQTQVEQNAVDRRNP